MLILFVAVVVPALTGVSAQSVPLVSVYNHYVINRYGFAIVNETVTIKNNGTSAINVPDTIIGLGNLTSHVVSENIVGAQQGNSSTAGTFLIKGGQSLPAGGNATFSLRVLLDGVVSHASNGSLQVMILTSPYVSPNLGMLKSVIQMPASTQFAFPPKGFALSVKGTNDTYSRIQSNVASQSAVNAIDVIKQSSSQDLHPLDVYFASRVISVGSGGKPIVTDTIRFQNLGTTSLGTLFIAPLTSSNGSVTVVPASEPPLLNPVTVPMTNYEITLTNYAALGAVQAGFNYTITYQYLLSQKYYTISGSSVTVQIPVAPPIPALVGNYAIDLSLPPGARVTQGSSIGKTLTNISPWKTGTLTLAYGLTVGWALSSGIPAASVLFALLLFGLFISRTTTTEEEETEEESATERASAMIKAFEDKTSLINQILSEIPNRDPNERDKAYFDELKGRLDAYRNRALQRLNEVKQKSTTQKFFELLNQLHTTERQVDRAAKDTLNLYEQYYTNRMRKETFDRLSPSYRKRLEKALDQLSEELHIAQREAKLL
jgi:hypothetical protein